MRIIFATGNIDKVAEANILLKPLGHSVEILTIDGKIPNLIEPQSHSLEEVAISKINQVRSMIINTELENSAIMVEDSGLFIDSLNNFPGVFSSFVYDSIGLSGILKLVNEDIIRGAEYRAVTIIYSNGEIQKSTGICRGRLSREELGDNGFGYDPIFIPEQGNGNTFSQMSNIDKSTISHRTYSLIGLLDSFKDPSK